MFPVQNSIPLIFFALEKDDISPNDNFENRVAFSVSISKYLGKVIPDPKKKETGKENL